MIPLLEEKMKLKKELYKEHVTSPDINEKDVKEDEILFEIYLKLEQPDENVIICPVCGLQVKSKRALSFHKYRVSQKILHLILEGCSTPKFWARNKSWGHGDMTKEPKYNDLH